MSFTIFRKSLLKIAKVGLAAWQKVRELIFVERRLKIRSAGFGKFFRRTKTGAMAAG